MGAKILMFIIEQKNHRPYSRSLVTGLRWLFAALLMLAHQHAFSASQIEQVATSYMLSKGESSRSRNETINLPDIASYTHETILELREPLLNGVAGRVRVLGMFDKDALSDFTAAERATEWAKRQTSFPKAIFIDEGYVTLEDVHKALAKTSHFVRDKEGDCITRLPIVVKAGGFLNIEPSYCKALKFSQDNGAFLSVAGKVFILNSHLLGWSEKRNEPAYFKKKREFRPFLVSWTASELYISESKITSFGYHKSKSYGISVTSYSKDIAERYGNKSPASWIINSEFIDMYYGFYCYHADDLVIIGNRYIRNILYGIDPHDYSNNLIIANNVVFDTKYKHGIIVSREVNNSWIINNKSFNNRLSGFVLDRSSSGNIVAGNVTYNNGGDGITFYESSNNIVYNNEVFANKKHGIRVRNSKDIKIYDNRVMANGGFGIYGHTKDLSLTDRNMSLDPYQMLYSLNIDGGVISANKSGSINADNASSIEISSVDLRFPMNSKTLHFGGALSKHNNRILSIVLRDKKAAWLTPIELAGRFD